MIILTRFIFTEDNLLKFTREVDLPRVPVFGDIIKVNGQIFHVETVILEDNGNADCAVCQNEEKEDPCDCPVLNEKEAVRIYEGWNIEKLPQPACHRKKD